MPIELPSGKGGDSPDSDNHPAPALLSRSDTAGNRDLAWNHLNQITQRLLTSDATRERDIFFIAGAIEMSNLSFVLGKGFSELTNPLQHALPAAQRLNLISSTTQPHYASRGNAPTPSRRNM